MKDIFQTIDHQGRATVWCVLDVKAGFHNIPVLLATQELLGVITQDGMFQFLRMPFGISKAPDHFQYVMD